MQSKRKRISLFEEAMEAIWKKFIDNPINKYILSYLYSMPCESIGRPEEIKKSILNECTIPPYNDPKISFLDIFEKSLIELEKDGIIKKNSIGYFLTPTGNNIAQLLEGIEAYQVFIQETAIEKNLLENITG